VGRLVWFGLILGAGHTSQVAIIATHVQMTVAQARVEMWGQEEWAGCQESWSSTL
jgi:hypothetical protein